MLLFPPPKVSRARSNHRHKNDLTYHDKRFSIKPMKSARHTKLRVLRGHDAPPGGPARAVMLTLVRVFSRWTNLSGDLLKRHGLTLPHFEVLMTLSSGEGISQQDLTGRLLLTKGNICIIVQKMEAAGLIDRRTDPVDQRFHRLYLTDLGRRLIANVIPEHHELGTRLFSRFSQADQKTLYELLVRVEQGLDDLEE
jgi:DNA-binding MarR family transcriptional regulator